MVAMTAEDLLNILEQRQLVAPATIGSLRQQLAQAGKPIAPAAIVKLLVDNQQITAGQAAGLLPSAAVKPAVSARPAAQAPKPSASQIGKPASAPAADLEEELGLAPLSPAAPPTPSAASVRPKATAKAAPAVVLDDELGLAPSPSKIGTKTTAPAAKPAPVLQTRPPAPTSLEDDLGLAEDLGLAPAKPVAAKSTVQSKPAAPANSPAPKSAAPKNPAVKGPAPGGKTAKSAAPANGAAPDLGLDEALFDQDGSNATLFDEGIFGAAPSATETAAAGPLDLPAGGGFDSALAQADAAPPPVPRGKPRTKLKTVLTVLGGVLAVAAVVGGIALVVLSRGTGDPEFQAAETDYRAAAWPAAVAKYNELLRAYPSQAHAGAARVHRGMAQLRVQLVERPDWEQVLNTAENVLPEISADAEFRELHDELAVILTDAAEALAVAADEASDPADAERRISQGRRALALADDSRYVPPAVRPWQRLQAVDDRLAVRTHEIERPRALAATVEDIRKAAAPPDSAAGFAAREKLIDEFPDLASSAVLRGALSTLVAAEAGLVKPLAAKVQPASSDERATPIQASASIVGRRLGAGQRKSGPPAFVLVEGALFALDSGTGQLLWRRFVGAPQAGPATLSLADKPVAGKPAAGGNVLVVDSARRELLRLDSRTGRLVWRQVFGSPLAGLPIVVGSNTYLTTREGVVYCLELKTGAVAHAVQLPALLVGSAVAGGDGKTIYQLSRRGELFALAAADLKCSRAIYVGTEVGASEYPPLALGRCVVVAENHGAHEGSLRCVWLDAQGLPEEVVSQLPIAGRIAAAPVALDNSVIVVDDQGTLYAFDVTANRDTPLKKSSQVLGPGADAGVRQIVAVGNQCWVAGTNLRRYELQKGRLSERGGLLVGDLFEQISTTTGEILVCLRHTPAARGAIVAGISSAGSSLGGQPAWEIEMADVIPDSLRIPPPGAPKVEVKSRRLTVVTKHGMLAPVEFAKTGAWQAIEPPAEKASAAIADSAECTASLRLSGGGRALWREPIGSELFVLDPGAAMLRLLRLPAGAAAGPIEFSGGLLVPSRDGALLLMDLETGRALAAPFRPRVMSGVDVRWTAPAARPAGTDVFVADDRPMLYQVGLQKEPQPQLVKLTSADLAHPVVAGPVTTGKAVYIVTRDGMLRAYELAGLKPAGEWLLPSRHIPWIRAVGELLLLATADDDLVGLGAGQKNFWKAPLKGGAPCGDPLVTKQGIIIVGCGGVVLRLAADSGKELAKLELGELLSGEPVLVGSDLAVLTPDGSVLKVAVP
jgi:outer membrane protein assembly factor BamB